jgi:hypothetical protein
VSGIYQLLVYADDANLLWDNVNTTKNTEALADASMVVGLEPNQKI